MWYELDGKTPVPFKSSSDLPPTILDAKDRRVGLDSPFGLFKVSTVFLHFDHSHTQSGPPLLFETMVFMSGEAADPYCNRYSTWEQAEKGHSEALRLTESLSEEMIKLGTRRRIKGALRRLSKKYGVYIDACQIESGIEKRIYKARSTLRHLASVI